MFPATAPNTFDEVITFMAGVGASRLDERWMPVPGDAPKPKVTHFMADIFTQDVCDPRLYELPAASWYFDDPYQHIQDWFYRFVQDFAHPLALPPYREQSHPEYALLADVAQLLIAAGYERRHTIGTMILYNALWQQISKADNGIHMGQVADIYYCAEIAAATALTGLQKLDCVCHIIDVPELTQLVAGGVPYNLAVEMYPPRLHI